MEKLSSLLGKVTICGLLFSSFLIGFPSKGMAQQMPQLGAEIFIEPGQTAEEVDNWVKTLSDADMPVARVFMMWNYIETKPGVWDFKLYDALFKAAEKYGVKITVTLVPNQPPFFWGKSFFYYTHNMGMYRDAIFRERSVEYIKKVVERYKNSTALDSWWLYNEPNGYPRISGSGDYNNWPLGIDEFRNWLKSKYVTIDSLNTAWQSYFSSFQDINYDKRWIEGNWIWQTPYYDWFNFNKEFIIQQILWLKKEVKEYDTTHLFTTNPPGVFNSLAHFDLPGMKKAVNILGASLHPSWFFSWVPRDQYGLAVSWMNSILYGVADGNPYWVSELQGGSNWHSEFPMDPTPNDIAQWVWTSLGSGANRIIFWLLNPRMQGNESTEWSLLDFQQNPSERMKMAIKIAEILKNNEGDFLNSRPYSTPISIIISPKTLLMQERKFGDATSKIAAVRPLSHQKAAMACYNALLEQGIPAQVQLIDNFNWQSDERGQVVILPDIMTLTKGEINGIKAFIKNGNKVIVTGLTGLYDEDEKSWIVNRDFPLQRALGGTIKDILSDSIKFQIKLNNDSLFSQLIYTEITPEGGRVIGRYNGKTISLTNNFGNGQTIWVPSLIGVGAWVYGDKPLSRWLKDEITPVLHEVPFRFASYSKDCYMQILQNKNGYLTIIINGSKELKNINLLSTTGKKAKVLFGSGWNESKHELRMSPNSTVVISWH